MASRRTGENGVSMVWVMSQCPWFIIQAIESRRRASPMRLVSAVIMPAARDFGFW